MSNFNPNHSIDTTDINNWSLIYENSFTATSQIVRGKEKFFPIPTIEISATTTKPYIAATITANYSPITWDSGGYLASITVINSPELNGDLVVAKNFLYLNISNLIYLPTVNETGYKFKYFTPEWFRDVSIKIHEYSGTVTDSYIVLLQEAISLINLLL